MISLSEHWQFLLGLALLLGSAELLVRSTIRLSSGSGQSRMLLGLTVVAFGTSAPELAIGVMGVLESQSDIGLGNIVGSNIFNILVVLGLGALIRPVIVGRKVIRRDIPILFGFSLIFWLFVRSGQIGLGEALILLALLVGYLVYSYKASLRPEIAGVSSEPEPIAPRVSGWSRAGHVLIILISIGLLALGSHWLIGGARSIAASFGISELIIGLTVVAFGTSLPEIATTLVAVRKREFDMAMGNVLGSCIFNIVAVPAVMAVVSSVPLAVSSDAVLFDVPVMLVTVLVCVPIFFSDHRVSRTEGMLFLGYYAAYAATLYIRSGGSESGDLSGVLLVLVLPILVLTLAIASYRALAQHQRTRKVGGGS